MKRRVVVTGLGAISPIGNDVTTMWENAKNGVNGIDFIKEINVEGNNVKIGGEIMDFDPGNYIDIFRRQRLSNSRPRILARY